MRVGQDREGEGVSGESPGLREGYGTSELRFTWARSSLPVDLNRSVVSLGEQGTGREEAWHRSKYYTKKTGLSARSRELPAAAAVTGSRSEACTH